MIFHLSSSTSYKPYLEYQKDHDDKFTDDSSPKMWLLYGGPNTAAAQVQQ